VSELYTRRWKKTSRNIWRLTYTGWFLKNEGNWTWVVFHDGVRQERTWTALKAAKAFVEEQEGIS